MGRTKTDLENKVIFALSSHQAVDKVSLTGSRRRGGSNPLSDWDFKIETSDYPTVADDLTEIVESLHPLTKQWDRLGDKKTYMLILSGAVKVDLLFSQPHKSESPWEVTYKTLPAMDHHFWDWILWISAKDYAKKSKIVRKEFKKMSEYLLRPMGVNETPKTIEEAVSLYLAARGRLESSLGVSVDNKLQREVLMTLSKKGGYRV